MKHLFYILLTFYCPISAGQNQPIVDSLNKQFNITRQDTSRVLVLSELAFQYRFVNADTGIQYAQHALTLARQIGYKKGEATALNQMAFLYREKGNLPLAMELHLKVLEMAPDNHLDNEGGVSMMRLGNIYRDLKDYATALSYQQQGLKVFERTNYKRGIALANMLIGQTFQEMNQLDSALYYEDRAKLLWDTFKFPAIGATTLSILGRIHAKLGNHQLALTYYRQSSSLLNNDNRTSSQLHIYMAQLYAQLKQTDSAIFYAGNALATARRASYKVGVLNAAALLSEIYEPIDVRKAFEYNKISTAAKDSLYSSEKLQALQAMTFNEQERQRNFEIEKKAYQNQIREYVLIGGLGVLLIIALILYKNNRLKLKANKVLEKTLTNLKSTQTQLIQSEKMASLGELTAGIAHEIQNPLNFVNNFSEVNTELIDELKKELAVSSRQWAVGSKQLAEELIDDIKANEQKINHHGKRAEGIVKGMLQHSRSSSGVKEMTDINTLCDEYLRLSYHGLRAKDKSFNAKFETDFDASLEKINVVPQEIGRVVLNLINNAFYAVAEKSKQQREGYEPTVTVSTKKEERKVFIYVKDNGNGIPESIKEKIFQPFFTTKPTGEGTGLGLSMSYDIVKAHGGEIKVETNEGSFSEFQFILPL